MTEGFPTPISVEQAPSSKETFPFKAPYLMDDISPEEKISEGT